ncbi:hypothetical protein MMC29_003688, partial [Sticta canariensis]|nr:hypothetical protein [Sticta canariensis]
MVKQHWGGDLALAKPMNIAIMSGSRRISDQENMRLSATNQSARSFVALKHPPARRTLATESLRAAIQVLEATDQRKHKAKLFG